MCCVGWRKPRDRRRRHCSASTSSSRDLLKDHVYRSVFGWWIFERRNGSGTPTSSKGGGAGQARTSPCWYSAPVLYCFAWTSLDTRTHSRPNDAHAQSSRRPPHRILPVASKESSLKYGDSDLTSAQVATTFVIRRPESLYVSGSLLHFFSNSNRPIFDKPINPNWAGF
jgi:hypothetical protein